MKDCRNFYIDGKWVSPERPNDFPVINPAREEPITNTCNPAGKFRKTKDLLKS
jgi:acyl-CoA reductase-like NAD-dependent aldehyde dehydrogenase